MTDELKKAMASAKTDEEKEAVAEKFKEEFECLSDEELSNVAGGEGIGMLIKKGATSYKYITAK